MFYAYGLQWFPLNKAPLGLFKFISDYMPYLKKKIYILIPECRYLRIDRNYLFGLFEMITIRLYTPLRNPLRGLHGVYNLIEVISSWVKQKLQSIRKYLHSGIKIYIILDLISGL
jgi:hypothetical protein